MASQKEPHINKLADDRDPWEQQPWEQPPAYERFQTWLKGTPRPTLTQVSKSYKITTAAMSAQVARNLWYTRQQAWDKHQEKLWEEEKAKARKELAKQEVENARGLVNLISQAIVQQLQNPDVTISDMAKLTDSYVKFKKEAFGEPPSQTIITGADNGPVQVENLSDGERIAMLQAAIDELQRRKDGQ